MGVLLFVSHVIVFNRVINGYFELTKINAKIKLPFHFQFLVFTWCHGHHLGKPKQGNGNHVGVPD